MKLTRIAKIGAIGAIAALALAGCAANESTGGATTDPSAPAASPAKSPARGSSAQEVAVQAWTAGFQTANPDVTITYDPVRLRRGPRVVPGRRCRIRRLRPRVHDRGGRGGPVRRLRRRHEHRPAPDLHLAHRGDLQHRGRRRAQPRRRRPSPACSPARSRTGTTRRSRRSTRASTLPDLAVTPVHRADDSGTTENFTDYMFATAAATSGRPSPTACGRSRAARPPRAPRASSRPSPAATAPSATPTRRAPPRRVSRPPRSRSATSS